MPRAVQRRSDFAEFGLGRGHGSGAGALATGLALLDLVFDLLSFGQIVKALVGHGGVVKEDVLSGISLNESEALVMHEFLNLAERHASMPPNGKF
jgi:hypothetical protein